MKVRLVILVAVIFAWGCGSDDGPKVPGQVVLQFPDNNSLCITGVPVTPQTSEVVFTWQAASNAATYELTVSRIGSGLVERIITSGVSAPVVIDRGAPYSWSVTARNSNGDAGPASSTWQFFNAGSEQDYPPFPAQLELPVSGSTVAANGNGEVTLQWSGADADGDLATFEIYLGTDAGNLNLLTTVVAGTTSVSAPVTGGGTVYYWEVRSLDAQGNASLSGTGSFRVL